MHRLIIVLLLLGGCSSSVVHQQSSKHTSNTLDVLLVSDHTLPHHLNKGSGGANGEERLYIDPTLARLSQLFSSKGLMVRTINVEDFAPDKTILDDETFNTAYATYDKVLKQAVSDDVTIISVHYDANFLYDENDPTIVTYTAVSYTHLTLPTTSRV